MSQIGMVRSPSGRSEAIVCTDTTHKRTAREVKMRIRQQRRSSFWRAWGTAIVSVSALVVIAAAAAMMMFAASAASAEEVPQRHDGRPDLSGTCDIATLTSAQRPEQFCD
jgi:hypothetical protein